MKMEKKTNPSTAEQISDARKHFIGKNALELLNTVRDGKSFRIGWKNFFFRHPETGKPMDVPDFTWGARAEQVVQALYRRDYITAFGKSKYHNNFYQINEAGKQALESMSKQIDRLNKFKDNPKYIISQSRDGVGVSGIYKVTSETTAKYYVEISEDEEHRLDYYANLSNTSAGWSIDKGNVAVDNASYEQWFYLKGKYTEYLNKFREEDIKLQILIEPLEQASERAKARLAQELGQTILDSINTKVEQADIEGVLISEDELLSSLSTFK